MNKIDQIKAEILKLASPSENFRIPSELELGMRHVRDNGDGTVSIIHPSPAPAATGAAVPESGE